MSEPVIEAKGLTKRYRAATAVDGVTFTVGAGEIFGLLGPNGAGKTTTILMLLGLSDISAGQARVFGRDPMHEPLAIKRLAGYLPNSVGFYDNLTAADNLHYTARLMGLPAASRAAKIAAALGRVGLTEVANKKVGTFSRGMRQRLGLAEIVMKDARVAILDEPTNGLDPQASVELLELIGPSKRTASASFCRLICSTAFKAFAIAWPCSMRATLLSWAPCPSSAGKCLAAGTLLKLKQKGVPMLRTVSRRCLASATSSNRWRAAGG